MVNPDINELAYRASLFRAAIVAIVQHNPKALGIGFEEFPRGACGDSALLLAKYLENNSCGQFDYVCGYRGRKSHAWLTRSELIIDITADQFEDQNCPVIVTTDHTWHLQFKVKSRDVADIERYDEKTRHELNRIHCHPTGI